MNNYTTKDFQFKLPELQDQLLNNSLVFFSIVGLIIMPIEIRRAILFDFSITFYVIVGSLIAVFAVTIYRKKLSKELKVYFLLLLILVMLLNGLLKLGFLATSKVYIAIIPIYLSFVVTNRQAIISYIGFLILFIAIGLLYNYGILVTHIDLKTYINSLEAWIVAAADISMVAFGVYYIGNQFRKSLLETQSVLEIKLLELGNNERRYRSLFNSSSDAILLIRDRRIVDCNPYCLQLFGYAREEIINKSVLDLCPEYQEANLKTISLIAKQFLTALKTRKTQSFDWVNLKKQGDLFYTSVNVSILKIEDINYTMALLRDITEKKKNEEELTSYRLHLEELVKEKTLSLDKAIQELKINNDILSKKNEIIKTQNKDLHHAMENLKNTQSQLVQSEKMASLGVLVAGVAHEINNPLNYILGGHSGLEIFFEENNIKSEEVDKYLKHIETGILRAANIVKSLNQFSRSNDSMDEDCLIHNILDNCVLMLNHEIKYKIELQKKYDAKEIIIKGNSGKLHQVFINIMINSIHAIPNKGHIFVSTSQVNDQIEIIIEDDGIGIEQDRLHKITDPFYTTKEAGKGTGLGLSIVYSIIQEHKGSIHFESESKKGTKVKVRLPLNN